MRLIVSEKWKIFSLRTLVFNYLVIQSNYKNSLYKFILTVTWKFISENINIYYWIYTLLVKQLVNFNDMLNIIKERNCLIA
jgi:hypothetical protein